MASERDTSIPSDNEGAEKPVREQLKKAHIAPPPSGGDAANPASGPRSADSETTEGVQQRSSTDEMRDGAHSDTDAPAARQHTRKRSRDSTAEEERLNNGQRKMSGERSRDGDAVISLSDEHKGANGIPKAAERAATPEIVGEKHTESTVGAMMSPKTKRSRLQPASNEDPTQPTAGDNGESKPEAEADSSSGIPSGSGFANVSTVSPFSALGGSKSPSVEPPQTSSSAFASSGFGLLSGAKSGFGSGGGFATPTSEKEGNAKASGSTFGGVLGQKPAFAGASSTGGSFGSSVTGFGTLTQPSASGFGGGLGGSGFGSVGASGGLKSFASGKSTGFRSSVRPARAFGTPADEDEEEGDDGGDEDDGAVVKSPLTDDDKQDERFYEQDLETGEEDETTQYSCRAKLYNFTTFPDGKKEWRERGLGVLRLNLKKSPDDPVDSPPKARFLMRAEGSHRVVLNTAIKKEIKFGDPAGGAPQGGYMYFMGAIDGNSKLELLQLKMRQQYALELHEKITELQAEM